VQRLLRRACRCSGDKSQCHLCRGSGYFQRIAAVDAYVPTEEFFTTLAAHGQKWVQPASLGWQVARKQATNRMHAAIRQLLNSGFIDQKEFDRAVHNKGGKDANLPCTSG